MQTTPDPRHERREPNQLAELLACEQELAELLVRAQEAARRLVEEARAEAGRAEAEGEASLGAESDAARAHIRDQTQADVRDIGVRARARVAAFEGIADGSVERLAEAAFRRLIEPEGTT